MSLSAQEISSQAGIHVLDCTLRDGGYQNNWLFEKELVNKYLKVLSICGVEIVELGFRFLQTNGFKGPHAYSSDNYLNELNLPENIKYGVMINAGDFVGQENTADAISRLFPFDNQSSKIALVRVACHLEELELANELVLDLKARGFLVGLNLMQVAEKNTEELRKFAQVVISANVDIAYVADSTGSLTPSRTKSIIGDLVTFGIRQPIGFHGHDNLGLALSNSQAAIEGGATWIDSTVLGMGRGPGNTKTEELLTFLNSDSNSLKSLIPLFELVEEDFKRIKREHPWGKDIYFYIAGLKGIHPTYVQEMKKDIRYSTSDIVSILTSLEEAMYKKFAKSNLDLQSGFLEPSRESNWPPKFELDDQEILIIAGGPSAKIHKEAIQSFIRTRKMKVLALNADTPIDDEYIDYFVACHPLRIISDIEKYKIFGKPLISPISNFPPDFRQQLGKLDIKDFGLVISKAGFRFEGNFAEAPNLSAFAYALAIAGSARANTVWICGIDGYPQGDTRNSEINFAIETFRAQSEAHTIAITPSIFDIEQQSVYGLTR